MPLHRWIGGSVYLSHCPSHSLDSFALQKEIDEIGRKCSITRCRLGKKDAPPENAEFHIRAVASVQEFGIWRLDDHASLIVGGSDAGISAALRARELDDNAEIKVLLADDFPNYSICGLPFYLSGETPDWKTLAHRPQFDGTTIYRGQEATHIDVSRKIVLATDRDGRPSLMHTKNS